MLMRVVSEKIKLDLLTWHHGQMRVKPKQLVKMTRKFKMLKIIMIMKMKVMITMLLLRMLKMKVMIRMLLLRMLKVKVMITMLLLRMLKMKVMITML